MKRKGSGTDESGSDFPAYRPDRVKKLFRAVKAELEVAQERVISYRELARYAGQAPSSIFDKLQKTIQPQVETLLAWLERLPEPTRNALVNAACRVFPTVESVRLAHDPAQVSQLKTLLRKQRGLTVIHGGSDGIRTYLITALGHSQVLLEPERSVFGIDVHEPDWFVPLTYVIYLHNLMEPARLKEYVYRNWPLLRDKKGHMVVLNGVWSAVQDLESELRDLALQSHVVIADDARSKPELVARGALRDGHVLRISEEKENRIHVLIQQIQQPTKA